MVNKDVDNMKLAELREFAKNLGIGNIYKYKKAELIEQIKKVSPAYIKRDGLILREKISPKIEIVHNHKEKKEESTHSLPASRLKHVNDGKEKK